MEGAVVPWLTSILDSKSNTLGSSPGQGHCCVPRQIAMIFLQVHTNVTSCKCDNKLLRFGALAPARKYTHSMYSLFILRMLKKFKSVDKTLVWDHPKESY